MARSKVKKSTKAVAAKKTAKNQGKSMLSADKMEKDFRAQPSKIAAQYRNESLQLKQQEKKLMDDLKKVQAQVATAMSKHNAIAAKPATTAATKKKLKAAKKSWDSANKLVTSLNKKLEWAKKQTLAATQKQMLFSNVNKEFVNFLKRCEMDNKKPVSAKPKASKSMKKEMPQTIHVTESNSEQEIPMTVSIHEPALSES